MKRILNGIIKENPTFVLLLGLCPALAVTTKFETAYMMGICVLVIVTLSNLIISIIKNLVSDTVRIPTYILIIGSLVTVIEILLERYVPKLYSALGIYLPLIVVNCIVLGRALSVASKESVKNSFLDGIGIGLGFSLALMLISFIREVLGTGMISLIDSISGIVGFKLVLRVLPNTSLFPNSIFVSPAGAFLTLGFLIALFNYLKSRKVGEEK